MLTVAVCRTKRSDHGDALSKAIGKGIEACGDRPVWVESRTDAELMRACDAAIMVCERNPNKNDGEQLLRNQVADFADSMRLPRLVIETGFLRNAKAIRRDRQLLDCTYWAAGWGGIKRNADYCLPAQSDATRWDVLGLACIPAGCKRPDGTVLVFGQAENGYAEIGLDLGAEYRRVIGECARHLPGIPVVFKPHPTLFTPELPRDYERKLASLGFRVDPYTHIEVLLDRSRVAITWASNASVDAVLQGVPVVCLSEMNPAWEVSEHSLSRIASPQVPPVEQRQAFVHRLAWCQWNLEEFRDGTAWRRLRSKIAGGT